jgi:hypothetical protein
VEGAQSLKGSSFFAFVRWLWLLLVEVGTLRRELKVMEILFA